MGNGIHAASLPVNSIQHKNTQNSTQHNTNTPQSQQFQPQQNHQNQQNINYNDPSSFNNSVSTFTALYGPVQTTIVTIFLLVNVFPFFLQTYRSTPNATASPSQSGIYAQPKQVSKMSSFRNSSPGITYFSSLKFHSFL